MKALRLLGIALGLLLALLAAGAGLLYVLFDGEKIKGELIHVTEERTQRRLEIPGKLELSLWPDVGIKLGRLTLSEPGGKREFLALDSVRVAVALLPLLSKRLQVKRIEVDGLKAVLVKKRDGTLNIADLLGPGGPEHGAEEPAARVGAGEAAGAAVHIDIAGIKVANAQLTWRDEKAGSSTVLSNLDFGSGRLQADTAQQTLSVDAVFLDAKGKTGADAFELKLAAPKLDISPQQAAGESLSLAATLTGSGRRLAAKLLLSGVAGNAQALKIGKLALDLDASSGGATLKGRLDSPVAVNPAAQTFALERIAGGLELGDPRLPMKQLKLPLAGNLRADLKQPTASLELATRLDESKIATKLRIARFAPLALGFDLDIDRLDLDRYLPPKAAGPAGAGTPAGQSPESKPGTLDFSALKGLDVNGSIRVGALQVAKLKLDHLNAKLKIGGGRLDVAPLTMDLYQGSASGSLALDAAGNRAALRQKLAGVSINPLMKDLANKDLLEGRGDLLLDINSQGDSVAALKRALAGSASLRLGDGAIKGINLAQSLRDLKGKLGARQDTTQQARSADKTDFSELSASFKIANGIARNEDLVMKSPFLRLSGAGDIDIGAGRMNYLAKASVVNTSAGQGGKDLQHLQGLTVPVRVSGPFEKLSYRIEIGSLLEDVAKAKLEESKQKVESRIEDKLKDKLKGLFGR